MKVNQKTLIEHDVVKSISKKGNCLDNYLKENLFGRLKEEMYYEKEDTFISLKPLKKDENHSKIVKNKGIYANSIITFCFTLKYINLTPLYM